MRALVASIRRLLGAPLRWLRRRGPAPSRAELLIGDHVVNTSRSTNREIY